MRFDQLDYAEYYHKQMVDGGYPGEILPFVLNELEGFGTILDIGSGTGLISVPLAESGHRVTAVEPSAEMIKIMIKNTSAEILSSIEICPIPWENWEGGLHDAAISVHSLYPMPDVRKAVFMMNESAGKKIIIIRDSARMKTLSGIVREKLGIFSNRDLNNEITQILNELSVSWKSVIIHEQRRHIIQDLKHEADAILYQLKLGNEYKDEILAIINNETDNISGIKFFNAIYSDNAYIFCNQ